MSFMSNVYAKVIRYILMHLLSFAIVDALCITNNGDNNNNGNDSNNNRRKKIVPTANTQNLFN